MSAEEIVPEPRSTADIGRWWYENRKRQQEMDRQQAIAERRGPVYEDRYAKGQALYLPFDPTIKASSGYRLIVQIVDGQVGEWGQVSKPRPEHEKTKAGGGPYRVNLKTGACNCPDCAGEEEKIGPGGKILPGKPGNGFCKHGLGSVWWLANVPYEQRQIGQSGKSALVVWDLTENPTGRPE